MKIQRVNEDNEAKVFGLLRQTFSDSDSRIRLMENLHNKHRKLLEWIAVQRNRAVGYIAFSNAYDGESKCGYHLTMLAVNPSFQNQGIGSEILRFAMRQEELKKETIFVVGLQNYFSRFNFESCVALKSPLETRKNQLSCLRKCAMKELTLGYEPEFYLK